MNQTLTRGAHETQRDFERRVGEAAAATRESGQHVHVTYEGRMATLHASTEADLVMVQMQLATE